MANDDTIDTLNDLIETSKDGETGFRNAYEHAQAPELKQVFLARAEDCRNAVTELQGLVSRLGGTPEDSGTLTEAMHRGWASTKGALTGYTSLSLLEETERGEDVALDRYRKALAEEDLPSDVRAIVERQYEGAKRNHMQIRTLRDQARATNH